MNVSATSYQSRVGRWLLACFGPEIPFDKTERNHRFLEEALETVQSAGCSRSEAHQLVDYVYGREVGDLRQEVGGVMNTLAALCLVHGLNMDEAGEDELARCWAKIEKIRAKQAAKPKHSPLPERRAATCVACVEWRIGDNTPTHPLLEFEAATGFWLCPRCRASYGKDAQVTYDPSIQDDVE